MRRAPALRRGATLPAAPSASKNYAQDWTYADEKQLFGVVRGEYLLNDNTRVWLGAGARQGKEHNLLANPTADGDGGSRPSCSKTSGRITCCLLMSVYVTI